MSNLGKSRLLTTTVMLARRLPAVLQGHCSALLSAAPWLPEAQLGAAPGAVAAVTAYGLAVFFGKEGWQHIKRWFAWEAQVSSVFFCL